MSTRGALWRGPARARRPSLRASVPAVRVEARLNTQAEDDSLLPTAEAAQRRLR